MIGQGLAFAKNMFASFEGRHGACSDEDHVRLAMEWLRRAQVSAGDKGVSEGYHLYHGWLPAYPETTGYIIETFFNYAAKTGDRNYHDAAVKMADWLVSIQIDDGSIPDSYFKKKMVFDTGQALFGFVRAFKETADQRYKQAAMKAADWIIRHQEADGSWIKYAAHEIPHVYYSRVAWGLLNVHAITTDVRYTDSCIKNIEWCLKQQQSNGWFRQASFNLNNHGRPFTHTIAYTIRGILESGIYLQEKKYTAAAKLALDGIAKQIGSSGFVAGTFDENWTGNADFSCLTGNVQLSINFLRLARATGAEAYYRQASLINRYAKSKQNISSSSENIRGAVAGSAPLWGKYIHYTYPNWAAKFFVDALMLEAETAKEYGKK